MKESRFNRTLKDKKRLAPVVIAAVVIMFLIRIILIRSGKLAEITELDTAKLKVHILKTEAVIDDRYCGTVIDSFKNSTKDEAFSTYLVTVSGIGSEKTAGEKVGVVLYGDDTLYDGEIVTVEDGSEMALIRIMTQEEASEASYNKDYFYAVKAGDELHFMSEGEVGKAVVSDKNSESIFAECKEYSLPSEGEGLYDVHGAYIGMICDIDGNILKIIPADKVVQFTADHN